MADPQHIGDVVATVMRDALRAATNPRKAAPERALVPRMPAVAAVQSATRGHGDARGDHGAGVGDGAMSGVRGEGGGAR